MFNKFYKLKYYEMKKLYYKFTKKYWSMLSYEHARKHNFEVQYGIFKNSSLKEA